MCAIPKYPSIAMKANTGTWPETCMGTAAFVCNDASPVLVSDSGFCSSDGGSVGETTV